MGKKSEQLQQLLTETQDTVANLQQQIQHLSSTVQEWNDWWEDTQYPPGCTASISCGGGMQELRLLLPEYVNVEHVEAYSDWKGSMWRAVGPKFSWHNYKSKKRSDRSEQKQNDKQNDDDDKHHRGNHRRGRSEKKHDDRDETPEAEHEEGRKKRRIRH